MPLFVIEHEWPGYKWLAVSTYNDLEVAICHLRVAQIRDRYWWRWRLVEVADPGDEPWPILLVAPGVCEEKAL